MKEVVDFTKFMNIGYSEEQFDIKINSNTSLDVCSLFVMYNLFKVNPNSTDF